MATKIKDGLFIGDAEASQDPEFIELNKITFVINCAGRQLPNLWEQHGLHYLTFPWTSDPDCTLFDGGNVVIEQVRIAAFGDHTPDYNNIKLCSCFTPPVFSSGTYIHAPHEKSVPCAGACAGTFMLLTELQQTRY